MEKLYNYFNEINGNSKFKSLLNKFLDENPIDSINLKDLEKKYQLDTNFLSYIFSSNKIKKNIDSDLDGSFFEQFGSITFCNTIFLNPIVLEGTHIDGNLIFVNCIFKSRLSIKSCRIIGKFGIKLSHLYGPVVFTSTKFESKSINIYYSKFHKYLRFDKCEINSKIQIKRTSFKNALEFQNTYFRDMLISNSNQVNDGYDSDIKKIKFSYNHQYILKKCGTLHIERVQDLQNFSIGGTNKSAIIFDKIYLDRVYMSNYSHGTFIFHDIGINYFVYQNSTKIAENFVFNDIEIKKRLSLVSINFHNTLFNNVFINNLYIKNTNFGNSFFNGVTFPEGYKLLPIKENNSISHEKMRDNYRQLKNLMDKNGNFIEGNFFYRNEMDSHLKVLSKNKKAAAENSFDLILYYLQKIISDFGNSWERPLFIILCFSLLRIIIITNIYSDEYNLPENLIVNILNGITPFMTLINTSGITFKSFIYNVILVILIYHFTIAIKRTTKR